MLPITGVGGQVKPDNCEKKNQEEDEAGMVVFNDAGIFLQKCHCCLIFIRGNDLEVHRFCPKTK